MKTKRSIIGVLFMAMLLCFVLVGCAEQTPTISLSDDSVSMYEGESHTLTVDAVDIGEESLHWAVDQGSVVSVTPSDDGRSATVAALAAGEATVTLTCGELTVRCVFTVKAPETAYIDVVYDGETTVEQGTVLDVSKLSAASSTAGLTYRYTIRQGDGAEEALTANYTLAGKGAYTVTAYAQEARYAGSSGTLVFTVAERVSDMQITYDGKNSVSLAVRQSLELSKISVSSATVTDKELEIEYALTMPDGTQRVLKDNYVFQTAGEYSVAANIVSDGYFGSVSLKVTVDPLVSLSEKMTVKYNDDIVENDSLEIDVSSDVKISVRDFSVTLAETIPGITYTYLLDGTALSEETDLTVGMHTLTVKASGVGYEGEKTITITAYKNYAVSMVADSIAFIGELFRYQASVENETFDYAYEVKYDGEEFAPFNGTFTRSGTAALRAMIEDPTNCHRGTSKEVSVTIGELGNEYDLEQPDIVLWYGLKAASNTTQYGNVAEVVLSNDVTVSLISVNTNVATASGNVVRAESVGETELYGKIDGKYYHICSIVVDDYSDYLAVATLDDVNAVKNNPAGKYVMVNDIDLNGRAGSMVENFSGIFDGNGYALKNGELNHSSISKDNYAFFSGTTSGTIRNIAFLGWEMSSTDGTAADNWSQMGIIGMIGDSAVVENIYVEATVSVNGGANKQSKGVLIGNADKGMVRNCIVNVSYTGDYTEFGTMFGATWAKVWENCYAIVSGIDANSVYGSVSDHDDYTNYASLAALKEAQSTAFAEGGVFNTAFFERMLNTIGRLTFTEREYTVYVGETFNASDVIKDYDTAIAEIALSSKGLEFKDGVFKAISAGQVKVTLTSKGITDTLVVTIVEQTAYNDVTISYSGSLPLQFGDALQSSLFTATSSSGGVLNSEYLIWSVTKDGAKVNWEAGEIVLEAGKYIVTLTVTNPASGFAGTTATFNFTVQQEVLTVKNDGAENAALEVKRTLNTVSNNSTYTFGTDKNTVQLSVSITSSLGEHDYTVTAYRSSAEGVATVDANGLITAVGAGTATIYATVNGQEYMVITVTVTDDYSDYLAVATLDDVNAVKNNPAGKYVMVNDIDLNGRAGSMVENFSGIFDGNGYALKNGELNHSSTSKDNYAFFSGTTSGTIRNIAFLGWEMSSTDGTAADNWSQMGIIGMIGDSAVVENIYVEATVSVNGGANKQSKGVLIGNADKGMVRNCIVNVSYTGDYTEFGTMFGATWAKVWENCYAIVSGVDANSVYGSVSDHDDYTNYASLAALKEAQSTAFAEGGVFDTAFFEKYLVE